VLLGIKHSLNGDSPSFLRDLVMYFWNVGANFVDVSTFFSGCLMEEGVPFCLLSSFLSYCSGMSSFFFMPPLPVEAMVDDMVSLGTSSSSKNLASVK